MHTDKSIIRLSAALALVTGLLSACAPSDPQEPEQPNEAATSTEIDYLATSRQLAERLQGALGPKLMAAMKSGGPPEAIRVCQAVAQDLTRAASESEAAVTIRRTALRVRNPENAPDALDREVLESWEADAGRTGPPKPSMTTLEDRRIVHRPIMMAELCLQCHGSPEQIDPETAAQIANYYPEDEATGFSAGAIRGAFRIEFAR
ncbi:MAG: DUF3365 domain-containing protein [Opitutales bacterium]